MLQGMGLSGEVLQKAALRKFMSVFPQSFQKTEPSSPSYNNKLQQPNIARNVHCWASYFLFMQHEHLTVDHATCVASLFDTNKNETLPSVTLP